MQRTWISGGRSPFIRSTASSANEHIVKRGDTLNKIARDNNVRLSDLIAANPQIRNPDLIFPGQAVNVPAARAQAPAADSPSRPAPQRAQPVGSVAGAMAWLRAQDNASGKVGVIGRDHRLRDHDASIGDHGVDPAEAPYDLLDGGVDLREVGHVHLHGERGAASRRDLGGHLRARVGISQPKGDVGPCAGQRNRGSKEAGQGHEDGEPLAPRQQAAVTVRLDSANGIESGALAGTFDIAGHTSRPGGQSLAGP